ncbi:MAG: alkaline phosphatase PafA [Bacteroidia bacterium]|jgi:predicted AlkP superfamily pyrophosphatase or phosphodiesterase
MKSQKALIVNLATTLCAFLWVSTTHAQNKPKLVIGIVVDQMRYDYLYKYSGDYGAEGFKKLLNEGFAYHNASYNYVPTYTGPGHASIYTGTTPARHGIVANDWVDPQDGTAYYCTQDAQAKTVGSETEAVGKMSPRLMKASTVGDELRIASNKRSKVFGIALKDRAAILPAGHSANAAFWFDGSSGHFVSSSFYLKKLPAWLEAFNKKQPALKYLNQKWQLLRDSSTYDESLPDNNPYEGGFEGHPKPIFPYDLKALMPLNGGQNLIRTTPFGNTLTLDLAKELIVNEQLGKDEFTDMLCISLSAPDYIGHKFGPDAREIQDCYLRLDLDLADFVRFTQEKLGNESVLFFLTADHGGAIVPAYLMDQRFPGGYMDYTPMIDSVNQWLSKKYKLNDALRGIHNEQLYLNLQKIEAAGYSMESIENFIAEKLVYWPGVQQVFTASAMRKEEYHHELASLIQKGFHPQRSGNVILALQPNWMEYSRTGTTHGSAWSYDTRVPLLWYGWNIAPGESVEPVFIDEIAPSISHILRIPFSNARSGNPLNIPLKK